jgi:hypothetical protein
MRTKTVEAPAAAAYNRGVAGKPKPAAQRMSRIVQLRLTPAQYRAFAKTAAEAGLPLTSWLRALGIRESRQSGGGTQGER